MCAQPLGPSELFHRLVVRNKDRFGTDGAQWGEWNATQLVGAVCTPIEAFTAINFDGAVLVRSNLGGQGGRCIDQSWDGISITWQEACDEPQAATYIYAPSMLPEIYVRAAHSELTVARAFILHARLWRQPSASVARPPLSLFHACRIDASPAPPSSSAHAPQIRDIGIAAGGARIDLRIRNETAYRAWNERVNGIKREYTDNNEGFFGVINLLGPRTAAQRPLNMYWDAALTFVQLRYEFLTAAGAPLTLGRTFLTFCTCQSASRPTESIPNLEP